MNSKTTLIVTVLGTLVVASAPGALATPTSTIPAATQIDGCDGPVQYVVAVGHGAHQCSGPDPCSDGPILAVLLIGQAHNACQGSGDSCTGHALALVVVFGFDNSACSGEDGHVCSYNQVHIIVVVGDFNWFCWNGNAMEMNL